MGVDSNGTFYAKSYYGKNGSSTGTITGYYALKLAASIKYAIDNGKNMSQRNDPDWLNKGWQISWTYDPWRAAVYKYTYLAMDHGLTVDSWFTDTTKTKKTVLAQSNTDPATTAIEAYSNNCGAFTQISKKSTDSSVQLVSSSGNETVLGPFQVDYGGSYGVSSIQLQDANNSNAEITGCSFQIRKASSNNWEAVSQIPKNENFYIKVTRNGGLGGYTLINVRFNQSEATYLKARMIMCKNEGKGGSNGAQNIGFYGYSTGTKGGNVIFSNIIINPGKIEIKHKTDTYTGVKLNMGYKIETQPITGSTTERTWLKENAGGSTYTYTSDFNEATEFSTVEGYNLVQFLSIEYKYKVWETRSPSAEYILEEQPGAYDGAFDENLNALAITDWIDVNNCPNYTYSFPRINIPLLGSIVVNKKDKETKKIKEIDFKIETEIDGEHYWLADANTDLKYDLKSTTGTTYTTTNGTKTLPDLPINAKFRIWETKIYDNDYALSEQDGYNSEYGFVLLRDWFEIKNYKISEDPVEYQFTGNFENFAKRGNVGAIDKKDADLGIDLVMGYKIQAFYGDEELGWVGQNEDGTYTYNKTQAQAKEFRSNEPTTNLSIDNKYSIWETTAPNQNYFLSDQDGYDQDKNAVLLAEKITLNPEEPYTFSAKNYSRVSITGYVWVDDGSTKDENYVFDSLYIPNTENENSLDRRLNGEKAEEKVTVYLKQKSDNAVIATTTIDNNGEYVFDRKILYKDMNNYYVEFNYAGLNIDGISGKRYIPVAYNSSNVEQIVDNGSRAMMAKAEYKDEDQVGSATVAGTGGIATTYKGNTQENFLWSSLVPKLYSNYTLQYMNLGLKPIYNPNYNVTEQIKYVKIVVNGHQYVYEYENKKLSGLEADPKVKYQSPTDPGTYTREIYPSLLYDLKVSGGANEDKHMKVYVVYQMFIDNMETYSDDERYVEKTLNITQFTNVYDKNRYVLEKDVEDIELKSTDSDEARAFRAFEDGIKADFAKWEAFTPGTGEVGNIEDAAVESEVKYTGTINPLGPDEHTFRYIQFRMKNEELLRILENPDGICENKPTKVHAYGYHIYTRNDYTWENAASNSLPKEQTHQTEIEHEKDHASYLKVIKGKDLDHDLNITGTVFEDKNIKDNGEVIGDGIHNDGEDVIEKAKVEVLEYKEENGKPIPFDQDLTVAKFYNDDNPNGKEAVMETNAKGEYKFVGLIPGKYYIRYTYGDGSQEIRKADGSDTGNNVKVKDYKSTIITSDPVKKALGHNENNPYGDEWYKYIDNDKKHSVAVDSLDRREAINDKLAKRDESVENDNIVAGTAITDITIENTTSTYKYIKEGESEVISSLFDEFHFGIIKQPIQELDIIKKIVNVKLKNDPNVIFNGNPALDNMPGVTDLTVDEKNRIVNGSTFTRIEVEETSIYGSDLDITYNIEVKNISDINYYETDENYIGWYYKFGEHGNYSGQVQVRVDETIDAFDKVLTHETSDETLLGRMFKMKKSNAGWVSSSDEITEIDKMIRSLIIENAQEILNSPDDEVIGINEWGTIERNSSANITLLFSKTLSAQDELNFRNVSAVTIAKNTFEKGKNYNANQKTVIEKTLKLTRPVILPEPALAETTISAPTGSSQNLMTIIYIVSAIVILSIGATGIIILLKKKQ